MTDSEILGIQEIRNRRRKQRYRINLSRHVYNEQEFSESFINGEECVSSAELDSPTLSKTIKGYFLPSRCTFRALLQSWFPITQWLPSYDFRTDLAHDIAGGLTVAIMHIPQGKRAVNTKRKEI